MSFIRRWKRLGVLSLGLAAAGITVSPVAGQQSSRRVSSPAIRKAETTQTSQPNKVVRLTTDGSFKVVVRSADGQPVGQSILTLVPAQQAGAKPIEMIIGNRGESTVSGVKPAVYQVRIEAERYAYQGTLQVRQTRSAPAGTPQLVAYTLQSAPGQVAAQPPAPRSPAPRPRTVPRRSPGSGALAVGLGGAAIATAIAVPLSVSSSSGRHAPIIIASP